jgi:hypothetical protein
MKFLKTTLLSACLVMTISTSALANSAPITMDSNPTFSISPSASTAISVESEYLEFDTSKDYGITAKVKAVYEMRNNSKEAVEQPMIFPFVNSLYENFTNTVRITKDGEPIEFNYFRIANIPEVNKGIIFSLTETSNPELESFLKIDNIINLINKEDYQPVNYSEDQLVTVYTVHLIAKEESSQVNIGYKLNPKKHKLLYANTNGSTRNANGTGTFTIFSPPIGSEYLPNKAYFVVFEEDNNDKVEFRSITGEDITEEQMTLADFLEAYVPESSSTTYKTLDTTGLKSYTIERLDTMLAKSDNLIALDHDVMYPFLSTSYIGAFLYTVNFEPESTATVTVEYEVQAARSREKTKDYTNTFLYLLQPASGWKGFGSLSIRVILHEFHPFIIESSLPLIKDSISNCYTGQFDGLPDKDFYFATYKTDEPDPPVITTMGSSWMGPNTLLPLLAFLVVIVLTPFSIARKRKRN